MSLVSLATEAIHQFYQSQLFAIVNAQMHVCIAYLIDYVTACIGNCIYCVCGCHSILYFVCVLEGHALGVCRAGFSRVAQVENKIIILYIASLATANMNRSKSTRGRLQQHEQPDKKSTTFSISLFGKDF